MDRTYIDRQAAIDVCNKLARENFTLKDAFSFYLGALHDTADGIKALPSAQQWIPCSERLPNTNGCYLVWRPHFFCGEVGMPSICYFDGQDTWHDSYGVDFERVLNEKDVTAWMPLPEPYKEDA